MALVVKNPPANARDIRDLVFIPGLGRSPGGGGQPTLIFLAAESPWTEELARYSPQGLKESGTTEVT